MIPVPRTSGASLFRLAVALLLGGAAACAEEGGGPHLTAAHASPEALAEAALDALRASDESALGALVVTREEYETLLWPSLPDTAWVTFDFIWGMSMPRTRKARRAQIEEYGGMPLRLVRVEMEGEREVYPTFTLHKDARMVVQNTATGEEGQIPLMDVVVEMDGEWKLLNLRDAL